MIKRVISFVLAAVLLSPVFTSCGQEDFSGTVIKEKIRSECAFITDVSSGDTVYISGEADTVVYPASTTKLLTSLAALLCLPADTTITPGDEVYLPEAGSSFAYIRPNHTLTLEMLIEGMLLPSGNDAAYATAAACGYSLAGEEVGYIEAVDEFVRYMNDYAESLGCTSTNFTTPDGYADEEHYSTLGDMALISRAAYDNEIIRKYAAMPEDNVIYASGHTNTWVNTNKFLDMSSKYYNKYVNGLKTGSLTGNYSLIVSYDDGARECIIGVFGGRDDTSRYKDAADLIKLYTKYLSRANSSD